MKNYENGRKMRVTVEKIKEGITNGQKNTKGMW